MTYKTPGVYIQEASLFPPSVAQVETAIPAFVGYTEMARDPSGRNLTKTPVRIKSLVEFQSLFGGQHQPATYRVEVAGNALVSATPDKFYLFDAMRQFYDNGGGCCYIVSVGSYSDKIDFKALEEGLDKLRKVDEPTLLLVPDAVKLDLAKFTDLQKLMLKQCAELQDRFAILDIFDIFEGHLPEDVSKSIDEFRDNIGINNLSYGAAYYPWVITSYSYKVSFRQIKLYYKDNEDKEIDIANYDSYAKDNGEKNLSTVAEATMKNADVTVDLGIVDVDKKKLKTDASAYLAGVLAGYKANIAANREIVANSIAYLNLLNALAVAFPKANAAAEDGVKAKGFANEIGMLKKDEELKNALVSLVAIEKNPKTISHTGNSRDVNILKTLYAPLETDWLGELKFDAVEADSTDFSDFLNIINKLSLYVPKILSSYQRLLDSALHFEREADSALFAGHQFFASAKEMIIKQMRTLPPSGTVAGIYAAVDAGRGVWKAPANVSISSIVGPAVKLDNADQEDLNVSATGKSINAIRAFTGKGTLVWGARTLAGNDNEWRYIPVRRFYIMVEESVKKATEPFVFEPNDANTWVKVRSMIENFLVLQWRAGALQGAKTEEAFFVHVGLNETMTAHDILEGRMIVEIGMAVVRPAEFIILRFSHLMQSGKG